MLFHKMIPNQYLVKKDSKCSLKEKKIKESKIAIYYFKYNYFVATLRIATIIVSGIT